MVKHFFQDMIKMKAELRKEMPKRAGMEPKEPTVRPAQEKKIEKIVEREVEQVWPPLVQNKVSRQVELITGEKKRKPRFSLWIVAIISLVFLFFAVSYLFSSAVITITPKIADSVFNQNLTAMKAEGGETNSTNLLFDLVVIEGEESKMVQGEEAKDVSLKAKGTVVIYNAYSSASQRLDIDTRLEGSNGKIYKTVKAVTVPGMKGSTPGSIEVGIYGAEGGEAYNSAPLDFKVFGFKGIPKYAKFYARSKGSITGGLVGKVSVIPEEKKTVVENDLKSTLQAKLAKKASGLVPPGHILFNDAVFLSAEGATFDFNGSVADQVPVSVKGTLYGFLLNEKELTKKIVETTMPGHDGSEVFVSNIKGLTFSLLNKDSEGGDVKNMSFNLNGKPKIVWRFDNDKLITELLGKRKKDFNQILSQYPNIESASLVLRPLWKLSFPSDKDNIKVIVNYP